MVTPNVQCPWLHEHMSVFSASCAAGRVPHALLIHESPGAGGEWLAFWAARLLLCASADGSKPCGRCAACAQTSERRHADLSIVQPIEESRQIRIEQIRELCAELALTSYQGGYKVGIITPADSLNRFAANALLKTLEEPPPRTLLVLVASQPSRLPATIMSRCQRIRIRPPARTQSLAWLRSVKGEGDWSAVLDVIGDAPLAAAELDPAAVAKIRGEVHQALADASMGRTDPVATAERWSRSDLPLRLTCIENWLTECVRRRLAPSADSVELRSGAHLRAPVSVMNMRTAFEVLDRVRELKATLDAPINRSLALENVLRALAPPGR